MMGRATTPFPAPLQVVEGTHTQAHVSVTADGTCDVLAMLAGKRYLEKMVDASNPNPVRCVDSRVQSY